MLHNRVLIADSDPVMRRFVRSNLEVRDYQTLVAMDGAEALRIVEREMPDIALINIVLKDASGIDICQQIREWSPMPIIILSPNGDNKPLIECLNKGADDFLVGPFDVEEIIARINVIVRRTGRNNLSSQTLFSFGDLKIKLAERQVTVAEREIKLTPTEYNLLQELALNSNKTLSHTQLLNKVWGPQYGQEREYLRVFVGRLRKKLEPDPKKPNYIVTVPWIGYKLQPN